MPTIPATKLLIVDDEPALMKALCDTLEGEGYSTSGFTSATAALAVLQEQSFDLVLSDLMMPEMDGIELLRAATEIDPHLVAIVMTGHGTIHTAVQAMQAGALDYILKPFKLSAILPVLARALGVRQLRMENVQLHEAVGIYKLSMAVALAFDFDAVLEKVAEAALGHKGVRGVSILVPTEDGSELRVAITRGGGGGYTRDTRIGFSEGLAGWVERSRERFARSSLTAELPSISVSPLEEIPGGLSLPMFSGGNFTGILHLICDHPGRLTGPGQGKALNILASAAASAIERASLMERLRSAEQRYRRLAENAPDIVFRYELYPSPNFAYVNPVATSIIGYSPAEYYADPELGLKITHPDDRRLMEIVLRGAAINGSSLTLRCVHRNGSVIWMEQHHMLVRDPDGRTVAVECIARDITERKLTEENIRRSLQEKDVMLNEIHHRVKNNLQVVSSLLALQATHVNDPVARHMFENSQNRIQSMALIHQQLYSSSNFAEIDFAAYLSSLANHLLASYGTDTTSFRVSLDAANTFLSLEEAVPCGLIVNELISNALKHSFHGRSSGEIRASFRITNGICTLAVDDDGVPLPADLFGRQPPTMGVRLVQALTGQLGGDLQVGVVPKFTITFADRRVSGQRQAARIQ